VSLVSCQAEDTAFNHQLKGKVKREDLALAPKVPGRILEIRVHESDLVQPGDTLAVLDVPEVEAKLVQARGAVMAAASQYDMSQTGATRYERDQVEAMYNAAREQFDLARKTFGRLKEMYTDSLIPTQKYDEVQMKYMSARAQLEAAEAKKKDVAQGVRSEKQRMAEGDYQRAKGALQEAEIAYSERFLIAPAEMTIETIALQEGELALPGYNIFTGYKANSTYFRFTVPESKVMQYKIGEERTLVMPYQENLQFRARITGIKQLTSYAEKTTPFPEYELGETVYEVKLVPLEASAHDLYANMSILMEE
jgi:HlyD family secretion protein